ncbi:MAG: complement resistance protein TraT, partial [Candidatus Aenigmatarchaeota archaeon]
ALVGSAIKIETFAGVVDIQLMEKTENPVVGKIVTEAKQGTSTVIKTEQELNTQYQIYRTKLAVTATQTNLKRDIAAQKITEMLAKQISGIF